ncbi:MAG: nucleoside diphosphate kinase regulator [Rhizobiaceae bacterium]|nr:nucleoside diphosphate kinase regulator [Rhizobiaceae bacterium]
MTTATERQRKPAITIAASEHEKLTRLAETAAARGLDVAEQLLAELDRARVTADGRLPEDIVRMGSRLRYTTDSGDQRAVTLVYPGLADIEAGRISILTPIGVALIGLRAGQSIDWTDRGGRSHRLTVLSAEQASAEAPLAPVQ